MTEANFALILGPYGVVVLLMIVVNHLVRENSALRAQSMALLKKYQDREDAERDIRNEETRKRADDERWRLEQGPRRSRDESNRTEGQP